MKDGGTTPKTAKELIDLYYLHARSALLETAAALDRIERAEGGNEALQDPRVQALYRACDVLTGGSGHRAEQLLLLLSEDAEGGAS